MHIYLIGFLCAAGSQTEAGDDFIKDQQTAELIAQHTQCLQKSGSRGHDTHVGGHRLHNDGCYLTGIGLQQPADRIGIIELSKAA